MADFDGIIDPTAGWPDMQELSNTAVMLGGPGAALNSQATTAAARLKLIRSAFTVLQVLDLTAPTNSDLYDRVSRIALITDRIYAGGADPTGVADSAPAINAALAAGMSPLAPKGTFLCNSGLTLAANGQRIFGAGMNQTTFKFVGNFDCITINNSGGQGAGFENLKIDASGMTGGYSFVANNTTIFVVENVRCVNGWNGVRMAQINYGVVSNFSSVGNRGTVIWNNDGTTTRSDGLRLYNVLLSGSTTATPKPYPDGFVVDGFFNTILAVGLVCLNVDHGIWHKNSAATTVGNFARYFDFEGDLVNRSEQVRLDVGVDIHFLDIYAHGSLTTDGIYLANGVSNVSFIGGKTTGHALRGINNNAQDVRLIGVMVGGNSQAAVGVSSGIYCGATAIGFDAVGSSSGLDVSATKSQKYGVEFAPGAQDCHYVGGRLRNNLTGEYSIDPAAAEGQQTVVGHGGDTPDTNNLYEAVSMSVGDPVHVIANGVKRVVLTGGGTLASYGVQMPALPKDGATVKICCEVAITTLSITGNTGQVFKNAPPTTAAANAFFEWIYRKSSVTWYRIG